MLLPEHIDKILTTYVKRQEVNKYSHAASFEEIKENDFNLNIPRYIDTFEEEEEIDIVSMQQEIEKIEAELVEVRNKMDEFLREVIA